MAHRLSLTLRNAPSEISRLVDRIDAFGLEAGLPPDVTFRLALSLDEIVANVIRHAFDDDAEHQILVTLAVRSIHARLPSPTSTRRSKSVRPAASACTWCARRWTRSTTGERADGMC
jgi:two-component sensor histidine kinase